MVSNACVLSSDDIFRARFNGELVIEPFARGNLTSVAIDVTLGRDFFFEPRVCAAPIDVSSKKSVADSWSLVRPSGAGITIPAGGVVVAHTAEFVGTVAGSALTTFLRGRSSLAARAGVAVSPSGGWGDVGFVNRWGLLIHNMRAAPVYIPFGMRVAQIVFLTVTPSAAGAAYEALGGSYGAGDGEYTHTALLSRFSPASILPSE